MKIGIVSGQRYYRVGDSYYTPSAYNAEMWKEYLEVFDEVILVDRIIYADNVEVRQKPAVTEGVRFIEYPNFRGFWALLMVLPRMFWRAKKAARQADVWYLRSPQFGSFCIWFWVKHYGIPYTVELTGSPSVNLAYLKLRGVKFPRFVRAVMRFIMKKQLSKPVAVIGVSKSMIRDFPPGNDCPTFAISDNRVPEAIYSQQRVWHRDFKCRTMVSLGNLEAAKDPLGTLRSLHLLARKGFMNWKFVWIGDGPLKGKAQQLTNQLGLSDRVNFLGFVPWNNVFEILNTVDLYLLYSLNEGLPRAMMEAMACALPSIGTNVGGVSELLHEDDIVLPQRDDMLADKLYEVLTDPDRLTEMSRRNLATAKQYSAEALRVKKQQYHNQIKTIVNALKQNKD